MKKYIFWQGLIRALVTFIYVFIIALFFFYAEKIFGQEKSFLIPVLMLMLFIISATITGFLILGKPIQLYLDNKKREGIIMLFTTLGWLIIFALIIAILLL